MEIKVEETCCRLCFSSYGNFINIFEDVKSTLNIAETLENYFQYEVSEVDPLPNVICNDCWHKTESFHEFHERVSTAREQYLQRFLSGHVKQEEEEEEEENALLSNSVTQQPCDAQIHTETISVEPMTIEKISIDDDIEQNEQPVLDLSLSEDDTIVKTDYQFESEQSYSDAIEDDSEWMEDDYEDNEERTEPLDWPKVDHFAPTHINDVSPSRMQQIIDEYCDMACEKCEKTSTSYAEAIHHYREKHNFSAGYVKCCDIKFKERKFFHDHILWHLNPAIFECNICGAVHKNRKNYYAHRYLHKASVLRQFKCDICNRDFKLKQKLFHHILRVHAARKKYFCEICKNSFRQNIEFDTHKQYAHAGIDTDLTPEQMNEFIVANFDLTCDESSCEVTFTSLKDAKSHYADVHNNPDGYIRCCNQRFKFHLNAREHIKWHLNPTIFQCKECGKLNISKLYLQKHMRMHKRAKKWFRCDVCDLSFSSKEQSNHHIKHSHRKHKNLIECKYCQKQFFEQYKLIEHMKVIHEPDIEAEQEKMRENEIINQFFDMSCDWDGCNSIFETFEEAQTHYEYEHQDTNGYVKCCDLKLNEKRLVKDHIKWHLNPEVFKCVQCNELFQTRNLLHRHTYVVHVPLSMRRSYVCDICQKPFTSKHQVKRHLLSVHVRSKEKTRYCDICNESFAKIGHLQAHYQIKHSDDIGDYEIDIKNLPLLNLSESKANEIMEMYFDPTCDICKMELNSMAEARTHYLNEHKIRNGYLKCCGLKLKCQTTVLDHINWHVDPNIFKCRLCDRVVNSRSSLLSHVRCHQALESKKYTCNICHINFPRTDRYNTHMKNKHGEERPPRKKTIIDSVDIENVILCGDSNDEPENKNELMIPSYFDMNCDIDECSTVFTSYDDARDHYLDVHRIENGYIKCCNTKFRGLINVKSHIAWHSNPDTYKCQVCGQKLKSKSALRRHSERHTNKHACRICNKTYAKKQSLTEHLWTHENREKNAICPICNKAFYKESYLKGHMERSHNKGEAQFICEFCAKVFHTRTQLTVHSRKVHEQGPVKPKQKFQCDVCSKWYASKGILTTHKLTHSSGPQKCTLCDKISPTAAALNCHMRAVHVEAKYNCHLCEKTFKLAPALKDHIATHLDQKQYKCTFCDESFIWRTNMYKHRKRIHQKEWLAAKVKSEADKMM